MRLIDADALDKLMGEMHLSLLKQYGCFDAYTMGYESAVCAVEAAPTIDAVPVVRCKDCVGYREEDCACVAWEGFVRTDDFCSYGKRRSDD